MEYINNPFNYHGGKFKLLSQIVPLIPKNLNNYIELFSGGFTVGLNVEADHYHYNDKCVQMVNILKTFKNYNSDYIISRLDEYIKEYGLFKGPKLSNQEKYRLIKGIDLTQDDLEILSNKKLGNSDLKSLILPVGNLTDEQIKINQIIQEGYDVKRGVPEFKKLRDDYNSMKEGSPEKSLMLYTLMCFSFNNQLGFNGTGDYNIPKGNGRSDFNSSLRIKLKTFIDHIGNIDLKITSKDFMEFVDFPYEENDFVYVDPPYLITDDSYSRDPVLLWDVEKEKELLEFLNYLDGRGVNFMLSNVIEHGDKTNTLLQEWSRGYNTHVLVKDYNNCSYHVKDTKKKTVEVIVDNYMIVDNFRSKEPEHRIISIPSTITEEESGMEILQEEKKFKFYPEEFKREMVTRNRKGEPASALAREFGFNANSLAKWKKDIPTEVIIINPSEIIPSNISLDRLSEDILLDSEEILDAQIDLLEPVYEYLSNRDNEEDDIQGVFILRDEEGNELLRDNDLEGVEGHLTYLCRILHKNDNKTFTISKEIIIKTRSTR